MISRSLCLAVVTAWDGLDAVRKKEPLIAFKFSSSVSDFYDIKKPNEIPEEMKNLIKDTCAEMLYKARSKECQENKNIRFDIGYSRLSPDDLLKLSGKYIKRKAQGVLHS